MKEFDLIVIGAGPGGYVSAIRAAQLGKKDSHRRTKENGRHLSECRLYSFQRHLLKHSEMVEEIQKANSWGIETGELIH